MNVSAWNRKSTSTAVGVCETGIWWEKHMTQSSSFRNAVLFGKNSSPFSSAWNRYWGGGRNKLVVSKKCPSWGMKTTNFHYKVRFHHNEVIHQCSCGTLTANPALGTLIWETRTHFASTSSVCLEKVAVTEPVKVSMYRKKTGRWKKHSEIPSNVRRPSYTRPRFASGSVFHCLTPLWGRMSVTEKELVSWCEHMYTNGSAASFLKPERSRPLRALNKRRQKPRCWWAQTSGWQWSSFKFRHRTHCHVLFWKDSAVIF